MNQEHFDIYNQFHLLFIKLSKSINNVIDEENIQMSREQIGVFELLIQHKQLSVQEIADKQGVFKTAISKRVKKLEEAGYVKKITSKDKRQKVIALTTEGYEYFRQRQITLYEGLEQKLNLDEDNLKKLIKHIKGIDEILKGES